MLNSIPRTDNFMTLFNARMKFLLGNDVTLGSRYLGWETVDGHKSIAPCETIDYDGKYLYVHNIEAGTVTELMGDMAEYAGSLIADKSWNIYSIANLRHRVNEYMTEHGIKEYTTEIGHKALWQLKLPSSIIDQRVKVYEMTRGMEVGA